MELLSLNLSSIDIFVIFIKIGVEIGGHLAKYLQMGLALQELKSIAVVIIHVA
jgi:hypothetical protein